MTNWNLDNLNGAGYVTEIALRVARTKHTRMLNTPTHTHTHKNRVTNKPVNKETRQGGIRQTEGQADRRCDKHSDEEEKKNISSRRFKTFTACPKPTRTFLSLA